MSQDNTGAGICVSYDNLGVELLRKSLDEACPKARLRHDRTLGHSGLPPEKWSSLKYGF
jgi:hypothetical protein